MQSAVTIQGWLEKRPLLLYFAVSVIVAWLILTHAWMTDDAYFSFRSVDNFINGHGLTWNITERVQGFTHPLWVLLLSAAYLFTREIYLTSIVVSLLLALALVSLILSRIGKTAWHGLAGVFLLCLSTAFIDYSTSGLENPLTHMLLGIFLWIFLRHERHSDNLFLLSLVAGLAAFNRLDTILFYAPALLYVWWRSKNKLTALVDTTKGFVPLALWEFFSVIYYGFPFPNTYYAKALNYVSSAEEIWAGLNYLYFTLRYDPITWVVILGALATAIWQRKARPLLIASGIWLYVVYILQIGGDFMGGRFLSAAYLASTVLLVVYLLPAISPRLGSIGLAAVFGLSLLSISPPYFLYARGYETARWQGVVDERMVYSQTNLLRIDMLHAFNSNPEYSLLNKAAFLGRSLWRGTGWRLEPENDWIRLGREILAEAEQKEGITFLPQGANGFTGYYAGPQVYFIHGLALTDGLLARVPPIYNPNWRSGHFMRLQPEGYLEIEAGQINALPDAELNTYYQKIRTVTHGPLFTNERWQAIWELNTRDFTDWLPHHLTFFRFPNLQSMQSDVVPGELSEVEIAFSGQGAAAQVDFTNALTASAMHVTVSAGDNFDLFFIDSNGEELGKVRLLAQSNTGRETHQVEVPRVIAEAGFYAVRLVPVRVFNTAADGDYVLHSLLIPLN